jgi:hypothetical protein
MLFIVLQLLITLKTQSYLSLKQCLIHHYWKTNKLLSSLMIDESVIPLMLLLKYQQYLSLILIVSNITMRQNTLVKLGIKRLMVNYLQPY